MLSAAATEEEEVVLRMDQVVSPLAARAEDPEVQHRFEALARASLGMGYGLEDFITLAGFDPFGDDLENIAAGGSGTSTFDGSLYAMPSDGGPGLIVASVFGDEPAHLAGSTCTMVFVCRVDGYTLIRNKSHAGRTSTPGVEHFPNPAPGSEQQLILPGDASGTIVVQAWGAGGGGG